MSRCIVPADSDSACACRLAVKEEIKQKGFPYLSSIKVAACRYGDAATQGIFVDSVWPLLEDCPNTTKNRAASAQMQQICPDLATDTAEPKQRETA